MGYRRFSIRIDLELIYNPEAAKWYFISGERFSNTYTSYHDASIAFLNDSIEWRA